MRPSAPEQEKGSSRLMLSKFNFEEWKEDVEDRCLRKSKTAETTKIAFLREGLTRAHKNQLRRAMKKEAETQETVRQKYGRADVVDKPFGK